MHGPCLQVIQIHFAVFAHLLVPHKDSDTSKHCKDARLSATEVLWPHFHQGCCHDVLESLNTAGSIAKGLEKCSRHPLVYKPNLVAVLSSSNFMTGRQAYNSTAKWAHRINFIQTKDTSSERSILVSLARPLLPLHFFSFLQTDVIGRGRQFVRNGEEEAIWLARLGQYINGNGAMEEQTSFTSYTTESIYTDSIYHTQCWKGTFNNVPLNSF